MQETPEIKIEEKLSELLAVSDKSYREVADEIGVSTSSIAQYRKGQSRPSLDNLVALSQVFNVSLDYLVFGEQEEEKSFDVDPVVRYMDQSLQDMQVRTAQHTSLVARVGRHISNNLDDEIEQYLSAHPRQYHAGVISDMETLSMEEHSEQTKLALRNFDYNLAKTQSETPGRFFMTVVDNLSQGKEYQYLLPDDADVDWNESVREFRTLLEEHANNTVVVRSNCHFKVTDAPIIVGFGLYDLNVARFKDENGLLYEFLTDHCHITSTGRIGYIAPPSISGRADAVMDKKYFTTADRWFDILWENGDSI